MVYENTHLFAADRIARGVGDADLYDILNANVDYYHLGAVFPDTLSYASEASIKKVASYLHGESGTPPRRVVFQVLDQLREKADEKNLAFICGFLTHCAMDIVFHPVVFYFSGYHPQNSPAETEKTMYLHWHFETEIDKKFNDTFYLDKLVKPNILKDLTITAFLNLPSTTIRSALNKQIVYFGRTRNRLFYTIFRLLAKFGIVKRKFIAGFYANLKRDRRRLPEKIKYHDLISGEMKETSLDTLMEEGVQLGVKMIEAAHNYYSGNINRQACEEVIGGNNLDTGQEGKTTADIKYSIRHQGSV